MVFVAALIGIDKGFLPSDFAASIAIWATAMELRCKSVNRFMEGDNRSAGSSAFLETISSSASPAVAPLLQFSFGAVGAHITGGAGARLILWRETCALAVPRAFRESFDVLHGLRRNSLG